MACARVFPCRRSRHWRGEGLHDGVDVGRDGLVDLVVADLDPLLVVLEGGEQLAESEGQAWHRVTTMTPGFAAGTAARHGRRRGPLAELVEHGAPVSEVVHGAAGRFHPDECSVPLRGRDSDGQSYQSQAVFSDPDGNGWVLQEITQPLPGRLTSPSWRESPRRVGHEDCPPRLGASVARTTSRAA